MRYRIVTSDRKLSIRHAMSVLAALALVASALPAPASTIYGWRDASGRAHFSNRRDQVPANAAPAPLGKLSIIEARPVSSGSPVVSAPVAVEPEVVPFQVPECDLPDASPLIDAITARLEAMRPDASTVEGLTLFVSGTPVSHSSNADVIVLPGVVDEETTPSEQAAVAYAGACPRTPPLERYAVAAPDDAPATGLCGDYRRAAAEIEIASSRNDSVTRTFQFAAARLDALTAGDVELTATDVVPPTWLAEAGAAQTAELAAEIEEFSEELTVAREEIDRAARAEGCW